ncbi:MAG: hypothetical protein ACJAQ6_001403 [Arenicella sp.]|jgi:hypothetical protein
MLDKVDSSGCSGRHTRLLVLVSLLLLSGCASTIVVKADIPSPLVEKLPLNTSLIYSDKFKDYVYFESEKKRNSLKSIDFTEAQTTMLQRVFSSLTNLVGPTDPSKDLSIEPEILDFQYSAPSETKLKQYEIWIKYRLKLRDANDASIADWTIKGYGKTPTGMLTSASSAFNSATNVALRDVGAQLSIRFPRQRVVKMLLEGGTPPVIPEPEPPIEVAAVDVDPEPNIDQLAELPTIDQDEVDKPSLSSDQDSEEQPVETDLEGSDES